MELQSSLRRSGEKGSVQSRTSLACTEQRMQMKALGTFLPPKMVRKQ